VLEEYLARRLALWVTARSAFHMLRRAVWRVESTSSTWDHVGNAFPSVWTLAGAIEDTVANAPPLLFIVDSLGVAP
jgi:hypothetical protein